MKFYLFLFILFFCLLLASCSNKKATSEEEIDIEEERYFVWEKKQSPIDLIELCNRLT